MTGIAIVGCGLIGAKRFHALPAECALIATYDPDHARAATLAELSNTAQAMKSLDEAVTAPGVDLVIVATPHSDLPVAAMAAIAAGRSVLIEKPGASTLSPLLEIDKQARAAGVHVRMGFNHRFHPAMLRALDLVRSGRYGRLLHLRGRYGHGGRLGYEKEWRAQKAISGGGELIDQGIHLIDLTRFLVGDVSLAFAELRTDFWAADVEDNVFLALRPANGGLAWLHASWTEWKNLFSLEIALERAKIEITGLGGSYGTESLTLYEMTPEMGPPQTMGWEWPQPDASWERELVDVIGELHGAPAIGARIEDGVAAMRIVQEAYQT